MAKNPNGKCNACGREEREFKTGFFTDTSGIYLYYCIAPHCDYTNVYFCNECLNEIDKESYKKKKCPKCRLGHLEEKKFGT